MRLLLNFASSAIPLMYSFQPFYVSSIIVGKCTFLMRPPNYLLPVPFVKNICISVQNEGWMFPLCSQHISFSVESVSQLANWFPGNHRCACCSQTTLLHWTGEWLLCWLAQGSEAFLLVCVFFQKDFDDRTRLISSDKCCYGTLEHLVRWSSLGDILY